LNLDKEKRAEKLSPFFLTKKTAKPLFRYFVISSEEGTPATDIDLKRFQKYS